MGCGLRGNIKWLRVEPKPGHCRTRLIGASPANRWGPEPVENPIHLPACLASRAREYSGSGAVGNIPVPAKSSAWGVVYRVTLSGSELNLSPGTARARLVGVSPANRWGPEPVENPIHLPACLASRARECSGSGAIGNIPVPAKSSAWSVVYVVTLSGSGLNLSPGTAVPDKPLGPWAR